MSEKDSTENGKPAERQGRKAADLTFERTMIAGLPKEEAGMPNKTSAIEKKNEFSLRERLLYFFCIPVVFTLILGSLFINMMKQDKGGSFAASIGSAIQADAHSLASTGKWAGTLFHKSHSAVQPISSPTGSPSPSAFPASPTPSINPQAGINGGTASSGNGHPAAPAQGPTGQAAENAQSNNAKQQSSLLAQDYSSMSPVNVASIIQNMDLADADLVLYAMKPQQRADILAKMNPKKAADITASIKDFDPSKPLSQKQSDALMNQQQSLAAIADTLSKMPPQTAEKLLGTILDTDETKAVSIMKSLDTQTRSQILSAMIADTKDPENINRAAKLTKSLL